MRSARNLLAILTLAVATAVGCATTPQSPKHQKVQGPTASASPTLSWSNTTACGRERWDIKTGTDPDAFRVDLSNVKDTTVQQLNAIPAPAQAQLDQDARIGPWEDTEYRVHAILTGFKMEADSDYHLVITDGGSTMITEIPYPGCVSGGPLLPGIMSVRSEFDQRFGIGQDRGYLATEKLAQGFQHVSLPVIVTGIGFFDFEHGQTGVADNAFELHPLQAIQFVGA